MEKSLARDSYSEESWFHIITCRQIDSNLGILSHSREHLERSPTHPAFILLIDEFNKRFPDIISKKGNNSTFWLLNTCWSVYDENHIESINKEKLSKILHRLAFPYDPEIVQEVYNQLRALAKQTAEFKHDRWNEKRITKTILLERLRNWINPYPDINKSERLKNKLSDAGLDDVVINVAKDQQIQYLRKKRTSGYSMPEDTENIENLVLDTLSSLRSSLDSGKINEDGVKFHDRCLQSVRQLQSNTTNKTNPVSSSDLSGCMYEITSRCRHRFIKLK